MFKQEFPRRDHSEWMDSSLIGAITSSDDSSNHRLEQNQFLAAPHHDQHCPCDELRYQSQPKGNYSKKMVSSSIGALSSNSTSPTYYQSATRYLLLMSNQIYQHNYICHHNPSNSNLLNFETLNSMPDSENNNNNSNYVNNHSMLFPAPSTSSDDTCDRISIFNLINHN